LFCFAFYNLYLFFILRDRAYLYYVVVQAGALIYLTADKLFFNVLLPLRLYNVSVNKSGHVFFFDINLFFEHIGVVVMLCGFLQFTRAYLGTKIRLPMYDKLLLAYFYIYIIIEVIPSLIIITNTAYVKFAITVNVFILLILITCVVTAIAAHKKGAQVAKYFLAAYLLPMALTGAASVYVILYQDASEFLPEAAIISQIFTFAIALVARIKLISDELKNKEIEAIKLASNIKVAQYRHLLIEEENKNISLTVALEKERNHQLQQKLEANQRELMGNSLYIQQKNKLLADLSQKMHKVDAAPLHARSEVLKNVQNGV